MAAELPVVADDGASDLRTIAVRALLAMGHSRYRIHQFLDGPRPKRGPAKTVDRRLADMARRYRSGQTLDQIGSYYGVTRERVRQILCAAGIGRKDGGIAVLSERSCRASELARIARKEKSTEEFFGAPRSQVVTCNDGISTLFGPAAGPKASAYVQQKRNAEKRGVAWRMTFPEWCEIWTASGRWSQRGRGADHFVMARKGDQGGYEPENVLIVTGRENCSGMHVNVNTQKVLDAWNAGGRIKEDIARATGLTQKQVWVHLDRLRKRGQIDLPYNQKYSASLPLNGAPMGLAA